MLCGHIFFVFLITESRPKRDDMLNPYWVEDKDLKHGEVEFLSPAEIQFWKDMISKYLFPIDENKEQQVIHNICFSLLNILSVFTRAHIARSCFVTAFEQQH